MTKDQRPRRRRYRKFGAEVWDRVRAGYGQGLSAPALSEIYGPPVPTIHSRAKREGWRKRDLADAGDEALPDLEAEAPAGEPPGLGELEARARLALDGAIRANRPTHARDLSKAVETLQRAKRVQDGRAAAEAALIREREAVAAVEAPEGPPWETQAHAGQQPPADGDWRTWLFMGGRGAGKTRAGAEWLDAFAQANGGARMALVGPALHDVREVMVDGPSGLLRLPRRERPRWEASRRRLVWPNEAVAYAFSAEDPESLRGPQHAAAWADEFCVWRGAGDTLALLRMGLRLGERPRLAVTTTPKPIAALRRLIAEPGCVVSRATTRDNALHLAPAFLDDLQALYGGTRLALQEMEGVLTEAAEGALWRAAELARTHGPAPAVLEQVVVAVDPPAGTASGEGGAACGIVVAGRAEGRGYVLADRSAAGLSPGGWAARAARAVADFGADRIVAEANQGGDMVRAVLAASGVGCAVELVRAASGKRARAEPVAALYEQGRITHCAPMPALEEELMALGAEGGASPDRADALVWALTGLLLGPGAPSPRLRVL